MILHQLLHPNRPTLRVSPRRASSRNLVTSSKTPKSSRRLRVLPGIVCILAWGFTLVSFTPRADGPVKAPWNRVAREDERQATVNFEEATRIDRSA